MCWSAVGSDLMRLISFAALRERSAWSAEAVGCWESMPAPITARSGFFDTMASPLVRIAGVMVVFAVTADGELVSTTGRPNVTTIAATTTEQVTATPSGTIMLRTCEPNVARARRVTREALSQSVGQDGGSQPTFGTVPGRQETPRRRR